MAGTQEIWKEGPLPLCSLNHISRNCADIKASLEFYVNVLGFVPVKRPNFLTFDGAWLFNYGIGIHLLQTEVDSDHPSSKHSDADTINPRDNHISFQCNDIDVVTKKLDTAGIEYVRRIVEEGGIEVEQLFFLDPDGFMIEVCTCEKLPIVPLLGAMGAINPYPPQICSEIPPSACMLSLPRTSSKTCF